MPDLDLEAIRARTTAASPGPWEWRGNTDHPDSIRLSAPRMDVFGMVRHEITRDEARRNGVGDPDHLPDLKVPTDPEETYDERYQATMEAAQEQAITEYLTDQYGEPRTEPRLAFVADGFYRTAADLAVYEVCPDATSRDDRRVYRADIIGFRHPDAEFIAHARVDIVALILEVEELRTDRERLQRLYHAAVADAFPEGGADA